MDVATPKELFLEEYHPNKVLHRMWGGGGEREGGGVEKGLEVRYKILEHCNFNDKVSTILMLIVCQYKTYHDKETPNC